MLEGFSEQYLLAMGGLWASLVLSLLLFIWLRPWKAKRGFWRIGARVFICLWTIVFLASAGESAFALFYDTTDSFGLVKTSQRWETRHVVLNNMGYRDRKQFSLKPQPGVRRILLLGDSFTFGHGIADISHRFGDLLEAKAEKATKGRIEIYNTSHPGLSTGTALELLTNLKRSQMAFHSVIYIYNLNDLEDLSEDSRYLVGSIILDYPHNWFLREGYLPNFLYYRFRQLSRPEVRDYFHWLIDSYTGPTWEKQTQRLDKLRRVCAENHADLSVVIFPFLHRLNDYQFAPAHKQLLEYWQQHDVPVLDLLNEFVQHADENLVVNRFDAHPNERAHQLAAEAIWQKLLEPQLRELQH